MHPPATARIPVIARITAAACLVVPPIVNAVLHAIDPITSDTDAGAVSQAVAHPTLASLDQFKFVLLLLAPGALVLAALAWRASPRLAFWGGTILCVGILAGSVTLSEYPVLSVIARSPHPAAWVPYLKAADTSTVLGVLETTFVLCQLIGFILLGVALYRSHAVARWVGPAVIASMLLNVVDHSVSARYVGVVAWALLAVAMLGCARELFSADDDSQQTSSSSGSDRLITAGSA